MCKPRIYPFEWFSTWLRFEKEAGSNSEMGYVTIFKVT